MSCLDALDGEIDEDVGAFEFSGCVMPVGEDSGFSRMEIPRQDALMGVVGMFMVFGFHEAGMFS